MTTSDSSALPAELVATLRGCDDRAQELFATRYPAVQRFLTDHLAISDEWAEIITPIVRTELHERFTAFERNETAADAPDRTVRRRASARYCDKVLLPLAQTIGFVEQARATALRGCWRRGCFDQQRGPKKCTRPAFETVDNFVRNALGEHATSAAQVSLLVAAGVCRDSQTADRVVRALAEVPTNAANMARGLVLSAIRHGHVSVVEHANYPLEQALLLLQQHTDDLLTLTATPLETLADLRADITALYHVLTTQPAAGQVWSSNLLHQPASSVVRQRYSARLTEAITADVELQLAARRQCDTPTAHAINDAFVAGGIAALIDLRCAVSTTAQTLSHMRITAAVGQHLGALPIKAQQEIIRLLLHLQEAALEVGVPVPIVRLLNEYPSSIYRIRYGRRLSFGYPNLVGRRQLSKKSRRRALRQRRLARKEQATSKISHEQELIAAFSRRAGLADTDNWREGKARIRSFVTSGGIGMLPRSDWLQLIDDRLVGFIYFFKLAKVDGTLDWSAMLQRLRRYAGWLDLPAPSSQLVKAVFNALPKPRYWHGGAGEAVAQVRQRASLVLPQPRLHETWIVLTVKLRVRTQIIDDTRQAIGNTCCVTVVFDRASQRPMGCWVDPNNPAPALALYQSLWHPGALDWPLRGAPEHILLPNDTVSTQGDDLQQAAWWMLADVQAISRRAEKELLETVSYVAELLQRLAVYTPLFLQQHLGNQPMTCSQIQSGILKWFLSANAGDDKRGADCFPGHRSPTVPNATWFAGVALPGVESPVAGWLLPITAPANGIHGTVVHQGLVYTGPSLGPIAVTCRTRMFPYAYAAMRRGIFVEDAQGNLLPFAPHM